MIDAELKETIKRELPTYLREDPSFRDFVLDLTRDVYADRVQTKDWFQQAIAEMREERARSDRRWEDYLRDREEQRRKWDEQNRKWNEHNQRQDALLAEQKRAWDEHNQRQDALWAEQNRKWDEHNQRQDALLAEQNRKWDEQNRKWYEHNQRQDALLAEQKRKWEEQNRKWDEQNRQWYEHNQRQDALWAEQKRAWDEHNQRQDALWAEQNRKWDKNQAELRRMNDALAAMTKKVERSVGALGARWGVSSEKSFRDALASILEENFSVEVINYNGYDDSGEVFGKPEQIELDVIITNGLLILCELKSSIDKAGMYLFERKARFYEREHNREASRLIVISPMIEPKALKVAERLGIACFGDSIEIERLEP